MRQLRRRCGVYSGRVRAKRPRRIRLAGVRNTNLLARHFSFVTFFGVVWRKYVFLQLISLMQWLTAEVLGNTAYREFVKTSRRQMCGFELILRERLAEFSTEKTNCDFVATIEDPY